MGWTAGATRTTGDLITAAQWNSYLGASGSLDYLKTEADKHDDCSFSDVGGSRSIDTIYQNTSGKTKLVIISVVCSNNETADVSIGSGSPPTTAIGRTENDTGYGTIEATVTFFVPNNWYYRIETTIGTPTLRYWGEWDIL